MLTRIADAREFKVPFANDYVMKVACKNYIFFESVDKVKINV